MEIELERDSDLRVFIFTNTENKPIAFFKDEDITEGYLHHKGIFKVELTDTFLNFLRDFLNPSRLQIKKG